MTISPDHLIASTLVELLRKRALEQPENHAYTFLIDGKKETSPLTYGELDRQARAIGAWFQLHKAEGQRALLLYPQGLDVIAAFCGCLYAGVIAIPVPPPESGRLKRTLPRLRSIVKDSSAAFVLTNALILELVSNSEDLKSEFPEFDEMQWFDTGLIDLSLADQWQPPEISPDTLAYLQYTSGSTSTPKGVMMSHLNLIHHCNYLQKACGYDQNSVTTTWMPYFHDYGLVEGMMVPLYNGTPCYLMSPFAFIKRPIQWLKNITRYGVTHSQAPNFAYDLCNRTAAKAKSIEDLDLSCWQAAGNAAEPINPKVMEDFVTTFGPYGFRWETFAPAYGLAEYTLLVSSKPKGTKPVFCELDPTALEKDQIVLAKPGSANSRTLPSCGRLVCETQVAIVHPDTLMRCAAEQVGEIWVADLSVTQGYWQKPEETERTFQATIADTAEGPFLRTGDLGFIRDGELYITGRIKDLIITRGANHYPQDIEWTVQAVHPAMRSDYGAAFSINVAEEERLVIVQEVERKTDSEELERLITNIRQAIAEEHEIGVYAIVLATPGNILKTASGKIQRRAMKTKFLAGELTFISDWCENPQNSLKFRALNQEVESLANQLRSSTI